MHHRYMHHRYMHHRYMHHRYMHHRYMHQGYMYRGYIELHKEVSVLVNFVWVSRPERPKGAKDEVKRPEGLPTRSQGPEYP